MATLGESTITKLTVNTIDTQNNNTTNLGSNLKTILLNSIYPIGSIYVYQNGTSAPSTCPIASTLGGTWVKIENKFLYSSSNSTKYGKEGGQAAAYLVDHTHTAGTLHTSSTYTNTNKDGSHSHRLNVDENNWKTDEGNTNEQNNQWRVDISYEWGTWVTAANAAKYWINSTSESSHQHYVPIPSLNVSGETSVPSEVTGTTRISNNAAMSEANMPPYFGVIAWKRTA